MSGAMSQFVTFRLKGQLMGMDILLVREINQLMESTEVQRAPEFIVGLINLRGQIVTIFDLAQRLGMKPLEITDETHNIILKTNGELLAISAREKRDDLESSDEMVGLRVDSIGDVMEFEETKIEPIPANIGHYNPQFLAGVVPLKDELLIILDAGAVLAKEVESAA